MGTKAKGSFKKADYFFNVYVTISGEEFRIGSLPIYADGISKLDSNTMDVGVHTSIINFLKKDDKLDGVDKGDEMIMPVNATFKIRSAKKKASAAPGVDAKMEFMTGKVK